MQIGFSSGGASWASQSSAISSPQMREKLESGPENDNDGDDQKAAAVSSANPQAGGLSASGRGQMVDILA